MQPRGQTSDNAMLLWAVLPPNGRQHRVDGAGHKANGRAGRVRRDSPSCGVVRRPFRVVVRTVGRATERRQNAAR